MNVVPFRWPDFKPDLSDYTSGAADAHRNVEPYADSYGPLKKVANVSDFGKTCRGGYSTRLKNDTSATYLFSQSTAEKLVEPGLTFSDVSHTTYNVPVSAYWSTIQFNEYLVATNINDGPIYVNVDTGGNFAALPNAPTAAYVSATPEFLFLGRLDNDTSEVAWSEVKDATAWDYGSRGSDSQALTNGGTVKGLAHHGNGMVVFQTDQTMIFERVPGDMAFRSRMLLSDVGCYSPYSIVPYQGTYFWFTQSGFRVGPEGRKISSERVNRYVLSKSSKSLLEEMIGAPDPERQIIWWLVPTSGGTSKFLIGYDYELDRWLESDQTAIDYIFPATVSGYTINSLDNLAATMNTLPDIPFDSAFYSGDNLRTMGSVDTSGNFGFFNGTNSQATLESPDLHFNQEGYAFLQSVRHIGDASPANVSVYIGVRMTPGASIEWFGPVTPNSANGLAFFRKRAYTFRVRIVISAGASWNNSNGFEVIVSSDGNMEE